MINKFLYPNGGSWVSRKSVRENEYYISRVTSTRNDVLLAF